MRRSAQAAYSILPCILMRNLTADTIRLIVVSVVSCQWLDYSKMHGKIL